MKIKIIFTVIGLLLITGTSFGVYKMVRGIRNNNPGNIRYNKSINWKGQKGPDDDGYLIFQNSLMGIRALTLLIKNYNRIYGLNTIRKIISRWAPTNENDTESYIKSVSKALNYPDNVGLNFETQMLPLVKAIIKHENGIQPYEDDLIEQAIDLTKNS